MSTNLNLNLDTARFALPEAKPQRILVAVHDSWHAIAIQRAFAQSATGSELVVVRSLEEFKDYRGKASISLVLLDLELADGCVLDRLESPPEAGPFPILVMASEANVGLAVTAIKRGAFDFVVKSEASFAALPHKVERAMREWRLFRQQQIAAERMRLQGAALEAVANAVVVTDRNGIIQWVNPAFTALTGYLASEAIGKNPRDFLKSGHHGYGFYRKMWETILDGRVWRGEIVNRRKDGALIAGEVAISPVRDPLGQINHFVSTTVDLTEMRALEARVLRSQRLESVGQLASGISHDLNNILSPILLAAPLLRRRAHMPEEHKLVDIIEGSATRGGALIRQLLTFSRGSGEAWQPVRLDLLLQEMAALMQETFPKNIGVKLAMAPDAKTVNGDATQLHQVVMNLCVNARDAMPAGGDLDLSLTNLEVDAAMAKMLPGAHPGRYSKFSLKDNGCGIAPEILDKIFDPYFTTKKSGEGTGLGLATVMGIIKRHGGFLNVVSKLQRGTTFEVFLPASDEQAQAIIERTSVAHLAGRGETILLVDDEAGMRTVVGHLLRENGYKVIEAKDGAEGMARLAQHRDEVQLVIADLMMPVMDGAEFVRALQELNPSLKVITVSGQGIGVGRFSVMPGLVHSHLEKPFTGITLLQAMQQALGTSTVLSL